MTQEAYVSFEVAKLLKEKGFNEPTLAYAYGQDMISYYSRPRVTDPMNVEAGRIPMPTQQMAMHWLREVHKMYVCIDIKCFMPHLGKIDGYSACIWYKPENNEGICCYWAYPPKQQEAWDTYEAATEAAIKYCLENLIKED